MNGEKPVVEGKEYSVEVLNGDNRRPGMRADHQFLVRFNTHPRFGWLCATTAADQAETELFCEHLQELGYVERDCSYQFRI